MRKNAVSEFGYASAYFLSKYLTARALAVDPDLRNYAICCKNLEPFGERAKVIQGPRESNEVGAREKENVQRILLLGNVPRNDLHILGIHAIVWRTYISRLPHFKSGCDSTIETDMRMMARKARLKAA
jgi:hypothetical protein